MEPNLFRYIWQHSRREQLGILFLVALSLPFYFLMLNLPKDIVNRGIQGQGFAGPTDTQVFLRTPVPLSETLTGEQLFFYEGVALDQTSLLLALSFVFLALVIANGLFKFVINTAKGRMGERVLRRLRYQLVDRLLRFPLPHLRRVKQAEAATMVKDEVEPLGGFIGDAFISPAFLGGQALTAMVFIMAQSVWLGMIALVIVVIQAGLIPKLRIPILRLGKQRQLTARELAGRVGELVDGGLEVHAHDTSNLERADISHRLGQIFDIRYKIFRRKFFVKFLNNFLSQLTPFIFYAVGGVLAIRGEIDIGALVAVIAAYKDLPGPVKELIDWEQRRQDVQIKYDTVIEQFQPPEILEPERQDPAADPGPPLTQAVELRNVTVNDDGDTPILKNASVTIPIPQRTAVVGTGASGKSQLAQVATGLFLPVSGTVLLDGRDTASLPEAVVGRRTAYVGPESYLFPGSVGDTLLYGLKHRPVQEAARDAAAERAKREADRETRASGNPLLDPEADWIDYTAAGVAGPDALRRRMVEVLDEVDMSADVYSFGLAGTIDPERRPETARALLEARRMLARRLRERDLAGLVEPFDTERYNRNATLGENLLFGTPIDPAFAPDQLADNRIARQAMEITGLPQTLSRMGLQIARTMVEIFADLEPGHPFFEQFSFIDAEELPRYKGLVAQADKLGLEALPDEQSRQLKRLPLAYVEARHRLELIGPEVERLVVQTRHELDRRIVAERPDAVEVFDPERYNAAASLQDNILFGRIAHGRANAETRIAGAIAEVLDQLGLRESVIDVGLEYQVGVAGKRLSAVQRQKLALGRALMKRPDLLVVDQATAIMDGQTQTRIMDRVLQERGQGGLIWVLHRAQLAERFERVVAVDAGQIAEDGRYAELAGSGGALDRLIADD
jgi:putative ABC transport system ATP-binding protein